MKRTFSGLGLLLLALLANGETKSWRQEPTGFRGLPWGASVSEARKAFPEASAPPIGNYLVIDPFEVGTVRTRVEMTFKGLGSNTSGGLWMISMSFPLANLGTMKALFLQKYGSPTDSRVESGDRLSVWRGKQVDIEIGPDSYERKGYAVFTVRAVDQQIRDEKNQIRAHGKAAEEAKKKRAKDALTFR